MKRKTFTDPRHTTRKLQRRRSALSLWTTYGLSPDLSVGGGAQCMDPVFRNALNNGTAALQLTGVYHNLLRRWADV